MRGPGRKGAYVLDDVKASVGCVIEASNDSVAVHTEALLHRLATLRGMGGQRDTEVSEGAATH